MLCRSGARDQRRRPRPRPGRPQALRAARRHRHRRVDPAHRQLDHVEEDRRGHRGAGARREGRVRRVHEGRGRGPGSWPRRWWGSGADHGVRTTALLTAMDVAARPDGRQRPRGRPSRSRCWPGGGPADVVELTLALAVEMLELAGIDAGSRRRCWPTGGPWTPGRRWCGPRAATPTPRCPPRPRRRGRHQPGHRQPGPARRHGDRRGGLAAGRRPGPQGGPGLGGGRGASGTPRSATRSPPASPSSSSTSTTPPACPPPSRCWRAPSRCPPTPCPAPDPDPRQDPMICVASNRSAVLSGHRSRWARWEVATGGARGGAGGRGDPAPHPAAPRPAATAVPGAGSPHPRVLYDPGGEARAAGPPRRASPTGRCS